MSLIDALIIYAGTIVVTTLVFISVLAIVSYNIEDFKHDVTKLIPRVFVFTTVCYIALGVLILTLEYFNKVYNGN